MHNVAIEILNLLDVLIKKTENIFSVFFTKAKLLKILHIQYS